jgi:hypothetical protein
VDLDAIPNGQTIEQTRQRHRRLLEPCPMQDVDLVVSRIGPGPTQWTTLIAACFEAQSKKGPGGWGHVPHWAPSAFSLVTHLRKGSTIYIILRPLPFFTLR